MGAAVSADTHPTASTSAGSAPGPAGKKGKGAKAKGAKGKAAAAADSGAATAAPTPAATATADQTYEEPDPVPAGVVVGPDGPADGEYDQGRGRAGASGISSGLRLEGISMTFKNQAVLQDVTWEVKRGERVGLVGAARARRVLLHFAALRCRSRVDGCAHTHPPQQMVLLPPHTLFLCCAVGAPTSA